MSSQEEESLAAWRQRCQCLESTLRITRKVCEENRKRWLEEALCANTAEAKLQAYIQEVTVIINNTLETMNARK